MALPVRPLPESSVEVNGSTVTFRSLSRSEALKVTTFTGQEDEAEVFIIAKGTGVSDDDARAWRDTTTTAEAGKLIDGILVFSGLATAEQVQAAEGRELPDPQPSMNGRSSQEALTLTNSS